jgi:hypothetical protein
MRQYDGVDQMTELPHLQVALIRNDSTIMSLMGSGRRRSLFDGLVILHRFMALSMPTCVTDVWVAPDPSRTTCPTHHEFNQLQHYQLLPLELSARPREIGSTMKRLVRHSHGLAWGPM